MLDSDTAPKGAGSSTGDAARRRPEGASPALARPRGVTQLAASAASAACAVSALCLLLCWAAPVVADGLVLTSSPAGEAGAQIDAAVISPALPSALVPGTEWLTYTVQPGDTLSAIAARYGLDAGILARRNDVANPDRIEIGQVLRVGVAKPRLGAAARPERHGIFDIRVSIPADGDLTRIQLWPWPPIQGQTVAVWMLARHPVTFSLALADTPYPVVADERRAWALIPISPMAEPGVRLLRVSAGRTTAILPLNIGAGVFETYDIPASVSSPILSQAGKVQAELERLTVLFAGETQRGWTPRDRFSSPLSDNYPRTSPFGSRRTYGGGTTVSSHAGEDFSAPPGTRVVAPAAGEVVLAEPMFVRGNAVVLDHGHGVFSGYWHLAKLDVTAGEHVEPGQLLGEVGSTGLSTGAHLHWELRIGGVAVDPIQWLAP